MKIILTISRFLAVVSSVIVGSLAIVVGENDDSPGLQGLGCILIISTLVVTLFGRIQQKSQTKFAMQPIGLVKSSRKEVVDDNWGAETSKIVLEDSISIDALTGLETFSHCCDTLEATPRGPKSVFSPSVPKIGQIGLV